MNRLLGLAMVACIALAAACASDGAVGDACDKAGTADGCESGAICANDANGNNYCRKTCTDQAQCSAVESCNGISGSSTKACQPKK